jgi:hypothetical protein
MRSYGWARKVGSIFVGGAKKKRKPLGACDDPIDCEPYWEWSALRKRYVCSRCGRYLSWELPPD